MIKINYSKFCAILNKHIFEGEKRELLKKLASNPERFIGLFRPSKPSTKILQHLLQSREIKFGNALEELIEEILKDLEFSILPKNINTDNGELLSLDQFFKYGGCYYFIEQQIRDDHDSAKKMGQMVKFEAKLKKLLKQYDGKIIGIMYFIDPNLEKNKKFYIEELNKLNEYYGVPLYLFYGEELFKFLKSPDYWEKLLNWLIEWKELLPEIPEINFDKNPEDSFKEIQNLEIRYWKKLLENEKLWEENIIKAIFNNGETLRRILDYFANQKSNNQKSKQSYRELCELLEERLKKYYQENKK